MASNKTLDPSTCTTASDAFKYSLPQVRQFHRSLTTDLDDKNARLRTLVGGSYRQVLRTAETILQMRESIRHAEDKLGRVGQGCGRSVIGEKATGLAKLGDHGKDTRRTEELQWVARMKVLEMCGVVVGKLLRRGGSGIAVEEKGGSRNLVLAAKVLVLSRLLAKAVGDVAPQRSAEDQGQLSDIKRKLGLLRRRLLRVIDGALEQVGENRDGLLEALSAYGLATNSGAKDVLRHFLHVRGEAMALSFDEDEGKEQEKPGVARCLDLYTWTLMDVQALAPKRLPEELLRLKTTPLLKDETIRSLEHLRLDACERWFGDEILFFVPYIRHDDLDSAQAVDMLRSWATKASEVLLEGLEKLLDKCAEFKAVVDLRSMILRMWNSAGGKAKGFDPSILFGSLRKVISDRLVELIETRVNKLHLVGTEIEAAIGLLQQGIVEKHGSLWDQPMLEFDLRGGAALFKQEVLARTHGRDNAVSRALNGYMTWQHLIDEMVIVIEQLRKQRWDDDLEDTEDDISLQSRNTLLSVEDPQLLGNHLAVTLRKAFDGLHEKIAALLATYGTSEQSGPITLYVLRIIRDIRTNLPTHMASQEFGLSLVPSLHERLAATASKDSLARLAKDIARKQVAGRALWEGDPSLPVQPSPATFRFLRNICLEMGKAGADLWSTTAVSALKAYLDTEIARDWTLILQKTSSQANGTTNGEDEVEEHNHLADDQQWKDVLLQSLFDICVLEVALGSTETEALEGLKKNVESQIDLEPAARARLEQSGKEYWKRTSLLFGLLA